MVPEEEGHRFEEGQGLPEQEAGLVPEEEAHRVAEEPGTLFSKEHYRSSRRTDHHLRHCGRILDRTESSRPRMNEYKSFLSGYNNKVLRSDRVPPKRHHMDTFGNRRECGVKKRFISVSKKRRSKPPVLFVGLFNDKYLAGPDDPDF